MVVLYTRSITNLLLRVRVAAAVSAASQVLCALCAVSSLMKPSRSLCRCDTANVNVHS